MPARAGIRRRYADGAPSALRGPRDAGIAAPGLREVFSQGEVLDTGTRAIVKTVLGVEPVSLYGLTELGYVAWQCRRREGFHVNADGYLVEVMRAGRPAAPGELGTLVVTDLRGRTMPHLRSTPGISPSPGATARAAWGCPHSCRSRGAPRMPSRSRAGAF